MVLFSVKLGFGWITSKLSSLDNRFTYCRRPVYSVRYIISMVHWFGNLLESFLPLLLY